VTNLSKKPRQRSGSAVLEGVEDYYFNKTGKEMFTDVSRDLKEKRG
jgi:hypothetical protein